MRGWIAAFDGPALALVVLGVLSIGLLPTGYSAAYLPWFLVETAGASLALWRFRRGELGEVLRDWRVAGPLSAWLGLSAAIAGIQIAARATESAFDTFRQLHFFAGGFLVIPLAALAFPALLSAKRRAWVGASVSLLLLALLIVGMFRAVESSPAGEALVWWPFVYRNHYAAFVLLVAPALCWQGLNETQNRWGSAVGVAAAVAGVVSSGSRSGVALLFVALGTVLAIWALRAEKRRRLWGLAFAAGVLVAATALANPDVIAWRLENAGDLLDGRVDYWRASLRIAAERPWLGWGYGTWPEVYLQFLTQDSGQVVNHAHSDWLEYLAEGGVVPFVALGALFARSLWLGFRHPWALGVPAVLLLAMADYPLRLPIVMLVLLCMAASAEQAEQLLKTNRGSEAASHSELRGAAEMPHGYWTPRVDAAASVRNYSRPSESSAVAGGGSSTGAAGIVSIIRSTRC